MKVCIKCNIDKDISGFSRRKSSKDGLATWCKNCNKEYLKKYTKDNKEKILKKKKEYYLNNREYFLEKSKNWRENNPTRNKEYFSEYYKNNKEELLDYKKDHYENNKEVYKKRSKDQKSSNKEEYLEYLKNWRKENRENIKKSTKDWFEKNPEKRKEYWGKLRKAKPHIIAWRCSLRIALSRMGKKKDNSTIEMLKYSPEDLKLHMESLFREGMSWDNWGEWHIDHIYPLSKFNSETPIHIVNALDNLQPLWAGENLSKNNKTN